MVSQQPAIVPTQPIPAKSLVIKTDKPRPYVCATCTRSFARLEHLKRHERSHTKEKPFQCPVCERSFARRDLLLRHKQKLHANASPDGLPSSKRNSISGPPPSAVRRQSIMSPPTYSPFSGPFSPSANPLNPLEHELMAPPMGSFSRSQSFSAVSGDSYMPDSLRKELDYEDTINPQMLRHSTAHPAAPNGPAPVHMGVRRTRRFNSNASTRHFVDSPDYSISSSLSQFDSPQTVPYQSPPGLTPQSQPVWSESFSLGANELPPHQGQPLRGPQGQLQMQQQGGQALHPSQLGLAGLDQSEDFMSSLLDLDDRFSNKEQEWNPGPLTGFSSGFSSLLKEENAQHDVHEHREHHDENIIDFPAYEKDVGHHQSPHHAQYATPLPHSTSPHAPPTPAVPRAAPATGAPAGGASGLQNLPSSQEVRRLVSAFYANTEGYVHFIKHGDSSAQNMALVMSEAALGALFLGELDTARRIFDLSRDCIRMFSDLNNISLTGDEGGDVPLWLVQAATLSLMYQVFDFGATNSQSLSQEAKLLTAMAIRAKLHMPPHQALPHISPQATVEEKYRYYQDCEYRVRTMYAVYDMISYLAIFLGQKPLCTLAMLECGSPNDDDLLQCANAQEWWDKISGRGDKWCETMPFSFFYESLAEYRVLGDNVHPTVLLSTICALNHKLQHEQKMSRDQQEKMINTWEATWCSSRYAVNMDAGHTKYKFLMSDCAPIAALAMMRASLSMQKVLSHIWNRDFNAMNRDLTLLRTTQQDELVDAASYALDAIIKANKCNESGEKLFLPSLIFLFEGAIVLSEALAVIEALEQPVEKHQRLLMRAHKTFSQLVESDVYLFAADTLFTRRDPAESLSKMAIRIAIAILQCNHPWPLSSFMVDVLRKRE